VPDRDFGHPQPKTHRARLHLDRPAVVGVPHAEPLERLPLHGAQRPEIGDAHAVKRSKQPRGQRIAEPLNGCQRSGLAISENARSHHQVGRAGGERREHSIEIGRIVAAIGVEECHRLRRMRAQLGQPGETRRAIAAARLGAHLDARAARHRARAVG
jgi:hypothetical protein